MEKRKVAFIGTGGRSVCYASAYTQSDDLDIVALADPSAENRKLMATRSGLTDGYGEYDDWREMLADHPALDGAVIASPNDMHADQAVACLERGLPIALEKPLATTKEDCELIIDAERANNGKTLIGFVLRSTPFYSKIHDLIVSGAIGQVVSIQADELPGLGVSSIMNRSPWRRHHRMSGGSMLEKSCHDLDILNWMMGDRVLSLSSYGGNLIFRPNPALPLSCDECGVSETCHYFKRPTLSAHEDSAERDLQQFVREESRCIYNIDKDVMDVQSITLQYESGAVATFMLNFHCMGERAGRNFHAVGQKGRIWGNLGENRVHLHDNLSDELSVFDTAGDGSGHGGGDRHHALELVRMMAEPDYRPEQNAYAGYLSAIMCFASDLSAREGRQINFRYRSNGFVDIG